MDARVPFCDFQTRVKPEWIDYNGHMNVAYYVLAFDQATDAFLENIHMGPDYARETRHSAFVVDMNVTYKRELEAGASLDVTTQLLQSDHKKLRLFHQMFHQREGFLAATNEVLLVHVDLESRRSAPFPPRVGRQIEEIARQHRSLSMPEGAGRVLAF
ncbi:thioesterase family protein [Motiliproteus sp. SC1-56]|uniref:thioesterase family protein n=1 Tax=Motiliproteus sp. SC1-56 TaxID=2799565 RepID=UPI001A8EE865|nr:thioesterase family protein [Motiliproteus sp. SC1-56]